MEELYKLVLIINKWSIEYILTNMEELYKLVLIINKWSIECILTLHMYRGVAQVGIRDDLKIWFYMYNIVYSLIS